MTRNAPAFISSPIIRRIPATSFKVPEINVEVVLDVRELRMSDWEGHRFSISWDDLYSHISRKIHKPITKRQNDCLEFVKRFTAEKHCPPTLKQICEGMGVHSLATANKHVKRLIRAGYLKRDEGTNLLQIL